jgi:phosphoglycolate phosphatase-like HAD superfamily hydrolase
MLVIDFDGVVCDALVECALVTWLGDPGSLGARRNGAGAGSAGRRAPDRWRPGSTQARRLPRPFLGRFRTVRDYSRTLDHFVVAHLPYADWLRGQCEFDRIFGSLPPDYVGEFTEAASTARRRIRTDEPDFWLGLHTVYPGVGGLLERHAPTTAIVTAKDEASVWDILRWHGLDHTVSQVIGECGRKDEAVRDLCLRRGVEPRGVAFIDDNLTNVRRVATVGVNALWAGWGYHTPDDLGVADRHDIAPLALTALPGLDLRSPDGARPRAGRPA